MKGGKSKKSTERKSKRPFAKNDFEVVLKSATKPLKKEQKQAEKEAEET